MPKSIISQLERYRRCSKFFSPAFLAFCAVSARRPPIVGMPMFGQVNIADVVSLVNYIFAGGSAPADEASVHFNCSNQTDIADAVYFISYVFASGPAPCDGPNCDTGSSASGSTPCLRLLSPMITAPLRRTLPTSTPPACLGRT